MRSRPPIFLRHPPWPSIPSHTPSLAILGTSQRVSSGVGQTSHAPRAMQPAVAILSAWVHTDITHQPCSSTLEEKPALALRVRNLRACLKILSDSTRTDTSNSYLPPSLRHTLTATVLSLSKELRNAHIPPSDSFWQEVVDMFLGTVQRLSPRDGIYVYSRLAWLRPPLNPATRRRAHLIGIRLLVKASRADAKMPRTCVQHAWFGLKVLGQPTLKNTTPLIRSMILMNRLSDAVMILSWYIIGYWEHGKPPPSRSIMHHLMIQMCVVDRVLRSRPPRAPGRFVSSSSLLSEYLMALSSLSHLLVEMYIPLVPANKDDIVWLIKALSNAEPLLRRNPHERKLNRSLRNALPKWLESLPCGRPLPPNDVESVNNDDGNRCSISEPSRHCKEDRAMYFIPPLSAHAYNTLIDYALKRARKPEWCRAILDHMTRQRSPPLTPDSITINILLKQSTHWRIPSLGTYALELGSGGDVVSISQDTPSHISTPRLLSHLDEALYGQDYHRICAIVHHIRDGQLRCPSNVHGIRATSVVLRLYPELRRARSRPGPLVARHPLVYAAAIRLANEAGQVQLALRVWRLGKHACISDRLPVAPSMAAAFMHVLIAAAMRSKRAQIRHGRVRNPQVLQARIAALQEYTWILQHNQDIGESQPMAMYAPLLRLLQLTGRTSAGKDAAYRRVCKDVHAMQPQRLPKQLQKILKPRTRHQYLRRYP